jgi:CDP-glycerol glycerophosphotransferase
MTGAQGSVGRVPRVSVVVPIYDVEPYIEDCLASLQAQTLTDLEVVMVDDGSHDRGPDLAGEYVELDRRFRLIRQANGGLGHARNVGVQHASGEFLAFLDSDDMVPPDAYARLLQALDISGADFATGDITRFDGQRTWPTGFLRGVFTRNRRATHVTRFRRLLSDRMAQNKLWRRSFWERTEMRFPVGVFHEDIPIVVPAHFRARSVDVLRRPVYLYRSRGEGAPSITQRRTDRKVLRDRVSAVESVLDFLARTEPPVWSALYGERVLAEDLRYHLQVLPEGDDAYRAEFLALAGRVLARLDAHALTWQAPGDRRAWQLVAAGRLDELLELLAFEHAHPDAADRRQGAWRRERAMDRASRHGRR